MPAFPPQSDTRAGSTGTDGGNFKPAEGGGGGGGVTKPEVEALITVAKSEMELYTREAFGETPEHSATVYVSERGSDGNSGLTIGEAVRTVKRGHHQLAKGTEAARNALAGDESRTGLLVLCFGVIEEETTTRKVEKVKTKKESAVVESASAEAGDVGKVMLSPGGKIGDGSIILSVVAGVSWTISRTTGFEGEQTVWISSVVASIAPTVTIRGLGGSGGYTGGENLESASTIKVKGGGVGLYLQSGVGEFPAETNARASLENFKLDGNKEGSRGIYTAAHSELYLANLVCLNWIRWGAWIGQFGPVASNMYACRFRHCGENTAEELTGGCQLSPSPNTMNVDGSRFLNNIGIGCWAEGTAFKQCEFSNQEKQTSFVNSGNGSNSETVAAHGPQVYQGCWLQGNEKAGIAGSCIVFATVFQAKGTFKTEYGIESGNGVTVVFACFFINAGKASIKEANAEGPIYWTACVSTDPLFIKRHTLTNIPATWAGMSFAINANGAGDFGVGSPFEALAELHAGLKQVATAYTIGARMMPGGNVQLRGQVEVEAGKEVKAGETVAVIPAGLRPSKQVELWSHTATNGLVVVITTAGQIQPASGLGAGNTFALDGLTFTL